MKWIRPITVILLILTAAAYFGLQAYDRMYTDTDAPVISSTSDTITVEVKAGTEKLLKGLSASDEQDGDLTSQIVVESMGPMLSDNTRKVNYVVCDSANNVGTYSRTLKYKDYKSPRFRLKSELRFPAEEPLDITQYLTVKDVLDGDLTSRITAVYDDYIYYSSPVVGTYDVEYQVTNSAGDSSVVDLTIEIYDPDETNLNPTVTLNKYIVYLKKGKSFNPYKYLESVTVGSTTYTVSTKSSHEWAEEDYKIKGVVADPGTYTTTNTAPSVLFYNDVYCDNPVDTQVPGSYVVHYSATTEDGLTGTATLAVIVED